MSSVPKLKYKNIKIASETGELETMTIKKQFVKF